MTRSSEPHVAHSVCLSWNPVRPMDYSYLGINEKKHKTSEVEYCLSLRLLMDAALLERICCRLLFRGFSWSFCSGQALYQSCALFIPL
jgi:hypothetical protein